jgi:hypothetical protein
MRLFRNEVFMRTDGQRIEEEVQDVPENTDGLPSPIFADS